MRRDEIRNRIIALIVFAAMLFGSVPLNVSAMIERDDETESENLAWSTVRLGQGACTREDKAVQSKAKIYVDGGAGCALREGFLQFDLTEYVENPVLKDRVSELYLKVNLTEKVNTGDVGVYILPQEISEFDASSLDGIAVDKVNEATGTSMRDDITRLATTFAPDSVEPTRTGGNMWPAVLKYMEDYPDATSVTFRVSKKYEATADPKRGNSKTGKRVTYSFTADATPPDDNPFLRIGYKTDAIEAVDNASAAVAFDQISEEDKSNITQSLWLPPEMNLTVESSDPENAGEVEKTVALDWSCTDDSVIDPFSGEVTRPAYGEADRTVTLTANVSCDDYQRTLAFENLTVLAQRANPYYQHNTLGVTEAAYVSEAKPDDVMNGRVLQCDDAAGANQISFMQFDLSASRNQLDALESIRLRLIPFQSGTNAGEKNITIYMTDKNDWDAGTLTYQEAADKGLVSETTVPVFSDTVTLDETGIFYAKDILPAVKDYFEANPAWDGVLTFKVESSSGALAFHGPSARSDDLLPSLIVVSCQDALTETKDHITAEAIYSGSVERVRGDLDLFSAWEYDADIVWSSSNEDVISPSGAVRRPHADTDVILTATITSGTEPPVTVTIPVTVLGAGSDEAYFQYLLDNLSFGLVKSVDFTLPVKLELVDVVWTTDHPEVTQIDGGNITITRNKQTDQTVKLSATISDAGVTVTKDFAFTIIRHPGNDLLAKRTILDPGGTKANAFDDSTETLWTPDGDKTLTIDLSSPKFIYEFLILYDGQPTDGLKIETSQERDFVQADVFTGEQISPNAANYISLSTPSRARYVRFTCDEAMEGVRFIGGYASTTEDQTGGDILESLRRLVNEEVTSDFTLPSRVADYDITGWTSSDTGYIAINGYSASVTRPPSSFGKSGAEVNLTAQVQTTSGVKSVTLPVVVPKQPGGSGSSGSSSGGSGSKGGGNGSSGMVMLPNVTPAPTPTPTPAPGPFEDLDSAKWAEPYIISLNKKGIVSGKGDGTFDPNGSLKREEMAKMLVTAFSLSGDAAEIPFEDVKPDDWYYEYVGALYQSGMTDGVSEDQFGVGADITRQDAAAQLARLLAAKGIEAGAEEAESFSDDEAIAEYAKQGVAMLRSLGIISGDGNGAFQPQSNITRAEIAKIIYLALDLV